MNPFLHQLVDFSRIIGLRDRLRCPRCQAVGTWKPHGGWLDFEDGRKVRRWLCKWCGLYKGPEGRGFCRLPTEEEVSSAKGWQIAEIVDPAMPLYQKSWDTPQHRCWPANPWRG